MEQEIQKLQARLDKAKEVFREMNAKDKEKDARIAELEAQLAEAVANANNNATEGEDAIAELTAQLKTMEQRYLDADGYCKKLDEDNTYLADQNEMLRKQVEGAKNDINELVGANANLKAQNETYAIANEDLRFENMKNKGERDRIQMDYDKNVELLKEVTDKNEAMQSEIFELKDKIKELESAVEYANSEKARLTAELDKADEYINKKEKLFENTQQVLNDKQVQIIDLQKTVESLTSSNRLLEDELAKTKHDKDVIKETVTKHVANIKKSMQGLNDGLGVEFDIFGN